MENRNLQPPRERSGADEGKEEDEDEEVKMETFFALVRNFKEMRDRRRKELMIGGDTEAAEKKMKKMKTTTTAEAWIPRFEREDFDESFQVRGPGLVLPKPCNLVTKETPATATATAMKMNENLAKSEDGGLDLNLAL